TLALGQAAELRGAGARLELPGTAVTGPAVEVRVDRRILLRALRLGFVRLDVVTAAAPALFHDDRRQFVFMPLGPDTPAASPPGQGPCRGGRVAPRPAQLRPLTRNGGTRHECLLPAVRARRAAGPRTVGGLVFAAQAARPAGPRRRRRHRGADGGRGRQRPAP